MPVLQLEVIHHIWQHGPGGRCIELALFSLRSPGLLKVLLRVLRRAETTLETSAQNQPTAPSVSLCCCWLQGRNWWSHPRRRTAGRRETPLLEGMRLPPISHHFIQPTRVAAGTQQCSHQRQRPQHRPQVQRAQQPARWKMAPLSGERDL